MFEVVWQEFNRGGAIVTKRKAFRTKAGLDRFIKRLYEKDNFWQILGTRDGD